jgi:hypothetical protein
MNMKRIINLTVWLVFLAWSTYAQTAIKTETASNKYKYYHAASADTVLVSAATVLSGSATKYYGQGGGFVVGLRVGYPRANDQITILNGVDTVYKLVEPASAPFIYDASIQAHLDTLIFVQSGNSSTTLIFRQRY